MSFRWTGQYFDSETNLCYNRFRYYSPETGSYLSQDPIGLAGNNPTLYAYVPDPNTWLDPFGLDCKKVGKGVYGDVGGHHIHGKAGFKDNLKYDPKKGFSISQDFMNKQGWNHQAMTNKQRELFNELAASGKPNTIFEHNRIAVEAIEAGGATKAEARKLVAESLMNLRKQGATNPTNIP